MDNKFTDYSGDLLKGVHELKPTMEMTDALLYMGGILIGVFIITLILYLSWENVYSHLDMWRNKILLVLGVGLQLASLVFISYSVATLIYDFDYTSAKNKPGSYVALLDNVAEQTPEIVEMYAKTGRSEKDIEKHIDQELDKVKKHLGNSKESVDRSIEIRDYIIAHYEKYEADKIMEYMNPSEAEENEED